MKKRVKAGLLSAVFVATVLLAGGNAIQVYAEGTGVSGQMVNVGNNVGREFSISANDLSVTENAAGVAEMTFAPLENYSPWRVPSNPSYYVIWLEQREGGDFLSPEQWDAFNSAVLAGDSDYVPDAIPNVSDQTLTWTTAAGITIGSSDYTSSELIVVDRNSTTTLPAFLDRGLEDGSKAPTMYALYAYKSNGDRERLFGHDCSFDIEQKDIIISWSDYLKDDYVYFDLVSGLGYNSDCDANTEVNRFFTTSDKLDAMSKMLNNSTITMVSDDSEGMVDNGNGTFTVKDNDLGSTVINAAVVSEGMVYRMYNPNTGEHFYTKDASERDSLKESGWNYEENASFETIAADEVGATPVYRVYNPNNGLHHYTMDKGEALSLKSLGWNYEGISLYVYGKDSGLGTPEYRLYNENDGQHHWTVDAAERDYLVSIGWNDEGIAWNVK